jgi:hypothetical protein
MYWSTKSDGTEWADPYDGLEWDNEKVEKPSKKTLDALNKNVVIAELQKREQAQKAAELAANNPVKHIEEYIAAMQTQIDSLNAAVATISSNTTEFITASTAQSREINSGMVAIKGFLMEIPNLKIQLASIKETLAEMKGVSTGDK